jgi:putative ABC transport system ATP-binding protein
MNSSITIQSLAFAYGGGPEVVDISHLSVGAGERVFLHGPSGCGKTTLLGLLTGILAPPPGSIRVLGRSLDAMSPSERDRFRGDHVGYVFQMFNLLPYLNAFENIVLPLRLNPGRRARINGSPQEEAQRLAASLGIADLLDRPVTRLSVGQQQRVAAARALIGSPELLICDEPTSALDEVHRDRFLDVLIETASRNKTTVVFVSHDRNLASRFDRSVDLASINRCFRASTGDD